jgi:hypothetical protein
LNHINAFLCSFIQTRVIGKGVCKQSKASSKEMDIDAASIQPVVDSGSKQDSEKNKAKDEKTNTVPLYKLFSFADSLDHLLMIVGTIGAIGNGISMPLMTLIFGNMINAFGGSSSTEEVVDEVSKVINQSSRLYFIFCYRNSNLYDKHIVFYKRLIEVFIEKELNPCYCVQVSLKFVYLAAGTFVASLLRKYISLSIS